MHKTGTSAIQRILCDHPERLQQDGVLYPEFGRHHDGAHHKIWFSLGSADEIMAYREGLVSELENAPSNIDTVILSSELLEKIGRRPEFACRFRYVLALFDQVDVLYFVRNQADLVQSIFKQWVKDDAVRTSVGPEQFLQQHRDSLHFDEYADWWAEFDDVSSLQCALYNGKWEQLWPDFLRMAGYDWHDLELRKQVNVSMDGERLKLKHWINANVGRQDIDIDLSTFLRKNFSGRPKTSLFSSVEKQAEFIANFANSNQRMANRYNVEGLNQAAKPGGFFQTASPQLIERFVAVLQANPETGNSKLIAALSS